MKAREAPHGTGLILLFGIVLVVAACAPVPPGREAGPPRAESRDLVAIHLKGSPQFNGACLSCHADVMKQTTLAPTIKEAHAVMVAQMPDYDEKAGVTNANCASCHTRVDALQHSGVHIRKNADVESCAACHGKSGAAKRKFYAE
ncbi:MAG: hypothetical protein Q8Q58_10810 [Candidatus Rokubacteria bacterium]|nr:hypothetical protein [Candidatus Rokubacteria bacterium]